MQCILSTFAELDLEEIADYIARDNSRRALSYIGEIREHCRNIVTFPKAAPLREEFGPGIRVIPFGRYLVFYTVHPGTVRIERILSRACQHLFHARDGDGFHPERGMSRAAERASASGE